MSRSPVLLLLAFTALGGIACEAVAVGSSAESRREVIDLNRGWRCHAGPAAGDPTAADYDADGWETVVVPHAYRLTSLNLDDSRDDPSQPTFHRDISWYRRVLPAFAKAERRVFLEFEGAHQVTDLWVNGRHVGRHAVGGYTPFHFDMTDFVRGDGRDVLALRLDNRPDETIPPDGHTRDYVLFGGLYRDVRLVVTDALHVTFPWEAREAGVRITTPSVSRENATFTVETAIRNAGAGPRSGRVVTLIADAEGEVVERLSTEFTVPAGADATVVQTGGFDEDVRLWSCDDPYLYRVHTLVEEGDALIDHVVNPLGLRWFDLRPEAGFLLNGEPIELIGANRHQQYPYLGDAVPNNLHRGDAIRFKRAGLNVVRLAHYPHDNAFLAACDELGILVCEEPPPWIDFGPPLWWDRLERAQRVMIRNHRNHPCVFGWAGGVNHRGPVRRLHYAAKEEDPTRLTMNNGTLWTGPRHRGVTDLYSVMDYRGATPPEGALMFGMEHSGSLDATAHQRIVSLYRGDPQRIGLTLWSAHDGFSFKKRGEERPNLSVWKASLWDPFRLPKPAFHWYRSELTDEPMVWVPDDRAQRQGSLTVFSNCEAVAIQHAGGVTEPRPAERDDSTRHLASPPFVFDLEPTEGPITAIGYRDGVPVAWHTFRQPGPPDHLELAIDTDGFAGVADGTSVLLAYARLCDAKGTTVREPTPPVRFRVEGPGEVVGDGRSGANQVVWQRGVAPALIRVGDIAGRLELTAEAPGYRPAVASIDLVARSGERLLVELPRRRSRFRIDLGGIGQHVEEGWTAWSAEGGPGELVLRRGVADPVTVSVRGVGPAEWTTTWGVPGDKSFLIEDGVESAGGLDLTLSGLADGRYTLKTWHHRVADTREETPPLRVRVTDADGKGRVSSHRYLPTFGREIQVSAAGGGSAGDGGSNHAAGRPATHTLRVAGGSAVTVRIVAEGGAGAVTLNGIELTGEPEAYRPAKAAAASQDSLPSEANASPNETDASLGSPHSSIGAVSGAGSTALSASLSSSSSR
ncbi:Beta-galactosidase [Botrimarina hoheduenensis]|uniref:Beta-galactosidase n=1 Tax=Botrimarina hoheduenensis TaxID=2528000 RepID=A0A5C5VR83_9BACT|nr:Beta-galactosidase [Botrimarina hoheduenensis]